MTALDLPIVDPMLVRRFTPTGRSSWWGGVWVADTYEVEELELAATRLDFDEDAVDCSNRIFQITTEMLLMPAPELAWTVFPTRRWRNMRAGQDILGEPRPDQPLLYLGNPIKLLKNDRGLHVFGRGEFTIKSGVELGY